MLRFLKGCEYVGFIVFAALPVFATGAALVYFLAALTHVPIPSVPETGVLWPLLARGPGRVVAAAALPTGFTLLVVAKIARRVWSVTDRPMPAWKRTVSRGSTFILTISALILSTMVGEVIIGTQHNVDAPSQPPHAPPGTWVIQNHGYYVLVGPHGQLVFWTLVIVVGVSFFVAVMAADEHLVLGDP